VGFQFDDLDDSEKRRLCDFMINRRVNLFLGSGVSLDSDGKSGSMRSAGKLRSDLVTLNRLPETSSLQQAYSFLEPCQVKEEIVDHYTCTAVGKTVARLAQQSWRRIYTLNVDNCFEVAFREVVKEREFDSQCIEAINFKDGFSELLSDKRCSIVHLHGTVDRPEEGFIFSSNEYAQVMNQPNSWLLTLSQLIRTDTFVVAGTSLDEIDVDFYLAQRNQQTKRGDVPPSILIEPFPNRLTEKLCKDHEFFLFEGTVADFFAKIEAIDGRIQRPWIDNENDGLSSLDLDHATRVRFSASFEVVPSDPEKTPNPTRFLLGAELTWSMLAANVDIPRDRFPEIRKHIVAALESPEFKTFLLVDEPGCGKTAFLKRLAFDLSRGSGMVFWYTGMGLELEPTKIAGIFNRMSGRIVVLVDNFADALNSISLILQDIRKTDILFVCAERDYRLSYIESAFTGEDYQQIKNSLGLTIDEANRLRVIHESEGISTISVSKDVYVRQVVGKSIAEANCRIQNNFRTIDVITEGLIRECDGGEVSTYLLISLARFCHSMGVRRSALSTVSFPGTVEFLLSSDASLPVKYSEQSSSFVVPRRAIIGDRILEIKRKSSSRELLTAFSDLALSLAPRVNRTTILRKTPDAQLLGRLMDYDNNVKRFIDSFAEDFYLALKPLCQWNARYWEQMSLLKLDRFFASPSDRFLLDESIQHARSAIAAQIHPFSLTTLAKVLFQAMQKSPDRRDQYFAEAWKNTVDADEREARWSSRGATLFVVCFGGVINFLKMGGQLNGQQYEKLRDMVATTRSLKIRDRKMIELRAELSKELQ